MSLDYLNEDYLFHENENSSINNITGEINKIPNTNFKTIENVNYKSKGFAKLNTITESNHNKNNLIKNTELNHVLIYERLANNGKNIENKTNLGQKNNSELNDNQSLSQMERKSSNDFYGNFENLIDEYDNSFIFESLDKKKHNIQGIEAKKILSENTSENHDDNFSSNLINNKNSATCNLNSNTKKNRKNLIKNEKKFNNFNNNNIIKAAKIFSKYDYNLRENDIHNDYNPCGIKGNFSNNNGENSNLNSILDSNDISNSNFKRSNKNKNKNFLSNYEGKKKEKRSEEEDRVLYELVPLYGAKSWKKIAEHIKCRSPIQCLHRWTKILQPGLVKGPWTIEEDRKLLEWVKKEGPVKWTQCSDFIKGRNGKQCRERWFHTLNPKVIKGNWTTEEDLKIFTLYQKLGGKWSKIALSVNGRTENSIKNRFYSTLRRKAVEQAKSHINSANNNLNCSSHSGENINCLNYAYSDYKARKTNQLSHFGSNYSLEDLLDFLPLALLEVKIKCMKEFNLTSEDLEQKQYEIMNGETIRKQKLDADYLKEKLYKENIFNRQSNIVNNNSNVNNIIASPQTINLNVNFNANHNSYIIGNEKIGIKNYEMISNNNNNLNPSTIKKNNFDAEFNDHNIYKNAILKEENNINNFNNHENQFKLDFSDQGNDYKNMDFFTLENNILDMCENPNFMFSDNNFGFLDPQVDHIIESIFSNNNINLANDFEKDCDMCFIDQTKKPANVNLNGNKLIKSECLNSNKIEVSNENSNKEIKTIIEKNNLLNNENLILSKNEKQNHLNINLESILDGSKLSKKLNLTVKTEEKKDCQTNKKNVLSSLISQLEDLERLVKDTKKELMKYNEKGEVEGEASEEAILQTVSLTNTIQKLFK